MASAQDCGPFFWFCQRPPQASGPPNPRAWDADLDQQSTGFSGRVDPSYQRKAVYYPSTETPGTIVVDVQNRFLYAIEGSGRATRYGIGVGRQGFSWSGIATVHDKQEWPDWYPPKEMIERKPELMRQVSVLQSGYGVAGGPANPLGARALYLWQGNKDTLYRIHGTNEPWTIGTNVSSGCIRMLNQDVIDLYRRTPVGAKVVVVASDDRAATSAKHTTGVAPPPGTRSRR
jgi:lipoprotein-anchoring transpeptidase ErfK/SrfK